MITFVTLLSSMFKTAVEYTMIRVIDSKGDLMFLILHPSLLYKGEGRNSKSFGAKIERRCIAVAQDLFLNYARGICSESIQCKSFW